MEFVANNNNSTLLPHEKPRELEKGAAWNQHPTREMNTLVYIKRQRPGFFGVRFGAVEDAEFGVFGCQICCENKCVHQ